MMDKSCAFMQPTPVSVAVGVPYSGPHSCIQNVGGDHVPVHWLSGLLAAVGSWAPGRPVGLSHKGPVALGHLGQKTVDTLMRD